MPNPNADRLDKVVAELVKHGQDALPEGPASPLGGEARPNNLTSRPVAEILRLKGFGRTKVDSRIAARQTHAD